VLGADICADLSNIPKAFSPRITAFLIIDMNLTTDCPLLHTLAISLLDTSEAAMFITRDPKLEPLMLSAHAPDVISGPVHLPSLINLTCGLNLILWLAPGSPLPHVGTALANTFSEAAICIQIAGPLYYAHNITRLL
jgi:hypothetical protein